MLSQSEKSSCVFDQWRLKRVASPPDCKVFYCPPKNRSNDSWQKTWRRRFHIWRMSGKRVDKLHGINAPDFRPLFILYCNRFSFCTTGNGQTRSPVSPKPCKTFSGDKGQLICIFSLLLHSKTHSFPVQWLNSIWYYQRASTFPKKMSLMDLQKWVQIKNHPSGFALTSLAIPQ